MDVTARALFCFVLPPVVVDALGFDSSFAASLARFGTALTGSMHIGVGAYWYLVGRSEALDAMVESCDSVFLQVLEGVRCLDQSPCIPAAIGMPGAGKSRLVMVEFVAIVEELARRYCASGLLASPVPLVLASASTRQTLIAWTRRWLGVRYTLSSGIAVLVSSTSYF